MSRCLHLTALEPVAERIRSGGDPNDAFEPKRRHALRGKVLSVLKSSSSGEPSTTGTKKQLDLAAARQEELERDSERDHVGEWLDGVEERAHGQHGRRWASAEEPQSEPLKWNEQRRRYE